MQQEREDTRITSQCRGSRCTRAGTRRSARGSGEAQARPIASARAHKAAAVPRVLQVIVASLNLADGKVALEPCKAQVLEKLLLVIRVDFRHCRAERSGASEPPFASRYDRCRADAGPTAARLGRCTAAAARQNGGLRFPLRGVPVLLPRGACWFPLARAQLPAACQRAAAGRARAPLHLLCVDRGLTVCFVRDAALRACPMERRPFRVSTEPRRQQLAAPPPLPVAG